MLNFRVNGVSYGIVFQINPVAVLHPRKGVEASEMVLATLFTEAGPVAAGWSMRSPHDAPNDERGMKESFARLLKRAFPLRTPETLAIRESFWNQYNKAMTKTQEQAAQQFNKAMTTMRERNAYNDGGETDDCGECDPGECIGECGSTLQ